MCDLRQEAADTAAKLERLAGILRQVAEGQMPIDPTTERVLCNMLAGLGESARRTRELVPGMEDPLRVSVPEYLPFNRKERFFTGSVLPGIVAGDVLAHLHHFLDLCGLPDVLHFDIPQRMNGVQFLTEYGFAESAAYDTTGTWDDYTGGRDTPDVVIAGPDWILAVEAKMFTSPSRTTLESQMEVQQEMLSYWADRLDVPTDRARLVALIAEQHRDEIGGLRWPIVTWQQVADRYRGLASPYWLHVLDQALDQWPRLRSPTGPSGTAPPGAPGATASWGSFGANAEDRLTGREICDRFHAGEFDYQYVGRQGGRTGSRFQSDCANNQWRSHVYEVRADPLPGNPNWFPIIEFIEDCCHGHTS